jgi:hypothetical protein
VLDLGVKVFLVMNVFHVVMPRMEQLDCLWTRFQVKESGTKSHGVVVVIEMVILNHHVHMLVL